MKFVRQNYYEILDVDPKASDDEVKRAYRLLRGSFEPRSMAIYSLYSPEESEAIGSKIDEVFRVLTNRDRRRGYDRYLKFVATDEQVSVDPREFFEQIHDLEELTPVDGREPSSEDLALLHDHGVAAEVEVEISQPDLLDMDAPTPEGIEIGEREPFDEWPDNGNMDASTEEIGELPPELAKTLGDCIVLPTRPVAATDDGACTAPSPAAARIPLQGENDESLEYEVDSRDSEEYSEPSLYSRPRMKSWTRQFAAARLAEVRSLQLTPIPDDELRAMEAAKDVSGTLLRTLRERRGVDLHTISDHTKISFMTLQFIEEDRFDALPAAIYLRGFLEQYTKMLGLPANLVDRYLARYDHRS